MKISVSQIGTKKYFAVAFGLVGLLIVALVVLIFSTSPDKTQAASTVVPATATKQVLVTATQTLEPTYVYPYSSANSDSYPVKEAATRGAVTFRAWCDSCHPNGQVGYGPALWGNNVVVSPAAVYNRVRAADARERERFSQLSQDKLNDIIAYIQAQERLSMTNSR